MPGAVMQLSKLRASGWATHPNLSGYPVLVHLIYRTRIVRSVVADQPNPSESEGKRSGWFNINLADITLSEDAQEHDLAFLVGETDEYLPTPKNGLRQRLRPELRKITVEDMIYENAKRHWVNGVTYVEAERAGLADFDIIDLLYRDLLGRPADPDGLANYIFQRREGILSFDDIKKSLVESDEYRHRLKWASEAPGAVFSQAIVFCAANPLYGADDAESLSHAEESAPKHRNADANHLKASASIGADPESEVLPASREMSKLPQVVRTDSKAMELEVILPLDSVLFGAGWHNVENEGGESFRWMGKDSVLFSPKPGLSCISINLNVSAVYGAHEPMVDCYLEDEKADVMLRPQRIGFLVQIRPRDRRTSKFKKLRISSRASGCPLQDERGSDERVLSLNLAGVSITYEQLDEPSINLREQGPSQVI